MLYIFTLFNESWLLYSLYNTIFLSNGAGLGIIATLFATSQISKIAFDIAFGFFLTSVNRKTIFSISCFLKFFAILLWIIYPSKTTFFIGMALIGIHMSSFMQHFEGYLFDIRKDGQKYESVLGKYYAVMNVSIFFTSSFLTYFHGISMQNILYIQLVLASFAAIFSVFLPNSRQIGQGKIKISEIIQSILHIQKSSIMFIIVISEALFMNFANMISVILESNAGENRAAKILMIIAIVKIPLNYISGKMTVKHPLTLNLTTLILSLPLFLFFDTTAMLAVFTYFVLYTVGIIHLYNLFHSKIAQSERMTMASITTIAMSMVIIFFDFSIGLLGVKNGICLNISTAIILIAILTVIFTKTQRKLNLNAFVVR